MTETSFLYICLFMQTKGLELQFLTTTHTYCYTQMRYADYVFYL